jgi:hypothetical protein
MRKASSAAMKMRNVGLFQTLTETSELPLGKLVQRDV